jgi:hypothetical protein
MALGSMRSYADFYRGMGLGGTIFMLTEAVVLWQLSSMAREDAARLRPMLWTFLISFLVLTVNSYFYFFSGPVITEIVIAACVGLAIYAANPMAKAEA